MQYGKLAVLKTVLLCPTFALLNDKREVIMRIPDIEQWLMDHLGKEVGIFVSEKTIQITDTDYPLDSSPNRRV